MTPADDAALFEGLHRVATASLAGVMLKLGLSNQWVRGPMPIKPDFPRVVGRAFTLRFIPVREDVPGAFAKKLPVNRDAVENMPAGCIAIADLRGTLDAATFRDIVVARMAKRGVSGNRHRWRRARSQWAAGDWSANLDERYYRAATGNTNVACGLGGTDRLWRGCCVSG